MQLGDNLYPAIGLFGTCGLMLLALFATWPAVKAYRKGRNFAKWYIFSFLLFPAAAVAAILLKERQA